MYSDAITPHPKSGIEAGGMTVVQERKTILDRFFYRDRDIHAIGKACKIPWFDKYDEKFARDRYAYFTSEEKIEATEKIAASSISDQEFVDVLNLMRQKGSLVFYDGIDRFLGEHYFFDSEEGFRAENRQDTVRDDVKNALRELKDRGYNFLQAVVDLYERGKWDRAYGGATWADILARVRGLGGGYPSPRDLAILKSYKLYYKTGSRRYPTHTIPEEILGPVEDVLKEWKAAYKKA